MGLFSDVGDWLFGGEDDSAQKETKRDNARRQQFIEEQLAQARDDAFELQPHADDARNAGYQSAIDMLTGAMPAQIDILGDGNVSAQETLIHGLRGQQNAILGRKFIMPKPVRLEPDLSAFEGVRLPEFSVPEMLSGPGRGTTNGQYVEQAYNQGILNDGDYAWFQEFFNASPQSRGRTTWGASQDPTQLMSVVDNGTGANLGPDNRARFVKLYQGLFGGGQ